MKKPILRVDIDDTVALYQKAWLNKLKSIHNKAQDSIDNLTDTLENLKPEHKPDYDEEQFNDWKNYLQIRKDNYGNIPQKIRDYIDNGVKLSFTKDELEMNPLPQQHLNFFLNLKPIDGAIEYIEKLKEHFDVWFLTRPSVLNPHCYTEKRLWVEKYFGLDMCFKLDMVNDKSAMSGDYLIDDVIWENFKGIQIQFGTEEFDTWDKVYKKLMENIS